MTEINAGANGPHDSAEESSSKESSDSIERGDGIETDGGRDSPKGNLRVTLDRDDVQQLMKDGTSVIEKEVGPITVNIRSFQHLHAVVMVAGRNKDPEPEELK